MNLDDYKKLFKGEVHLNWDRAMKEKWIIEQEIIDTRERLGTMLTAWTVEGIIGEGGKHLTFAQVAADLGSVDRAWRLRIIAFAQAFESQQKKVIIVVPAIALEEARFAIRDGCHRCAALMLSRVPFSVVMLAVHSKEALWSTKDYV